MQINQEILAALYQRLVQESQGDPSHSESVQLYRDIERTLKTEEPLTDTRPPRRRAQHTLSSLNEDDMRMFAAREAHREPLPTETEAETENGES